MSRPQEQVEDQLELEEDIISGNGEADEVMDDVEDGYSKFQRIATNSLHSWLHQHLLPLLPRSRGLAGFALYPATSTFVKYRKTLSKMIST